MNHQSVGPKQRLPIRSETTRPQTASFEAQQTPLPGLPLTAAWSPQHVLRLQRLIGNRAVSQALGRSSPHIQRSLTSDLSDVLSDENDQETSQYDRMRAILEDFSQRSDTGKMAERQTAYQKLKDQISASEQIKSHEKTVLLSLLLEGSLEWQNTDDTRSIRNHFASYFLHDDDSADLDADLNQSSLNCWETVLFIAHKANALSRSDVKELHYREPYLSKSAVWNFLGYNHSAGQYTQSDIKTFTAEPGQIIFYSTDKEKTHVGHVGLALGGQEIMSLWNEPDGITHLQRIPVGSIIGQMTVSVANPPWMSGPTNIADAIGQAYEASSAQLDEQMGENIKVIMNPDKNFIPYPPTDSVLVGELKETIKQAMITMMEETGGYDNYEVAEKIEEVYPQYFIKPVDNRITPIMTVLKQRLKQDAHDDFGSEVEKMAAKAEPEKIIKAILDQYDFFLIDEEKALEVQIQEAVEAYKQMVA